MKELFLFLLLLFWNTLKPALSLSPDGLSLLSLKSSVDDQQADKSAFADWNENDTTPCRWSGVSCMIGIAVSGKNLRGYIPSELGNLIYLRWLNLHDNNFYGSIPDQLFNATSLHTLFLYGNNLSGSLPPSICSNLRSLQNLDLSDNSLSGYLPKNLKNCKQLQRLILGKNKFSGAIPDGICHGLDNLVQLDLSSNEFNGSIPSTIGELKLLSGTLNLSHNHFSGELPKTLGDLPVSVSFDLRNNHLSGEIPETGSFANQGPTSFLNNPLLCGFPLQKSCKNSNSTQNSGPDSGESQRKKGVSAGLIILISAADAAAVALVGLIIVYVYWKKKDSSSSSSSSSNRCSCTGKVKFGDNDKGKLCSLCSCLCINGFTDEDSEKGESQRSGKEDGELVSIDKGFSFELDELLRASAYVLGKSGLGIVYKVVLGNGVPVAVRRLGEGGDQRYKEFVGEVQAIGKVKHPNVVKLRGYYWAPDEKLLICDFISNGNLANAMRGRNGQASTSLAWSTRLKIAKGAARGLVYLHECSPRKFVHGNIKPSNILLDNEFHPHISDFGLYRLISITASDNNNPSSSSSGGGGFIGGLPYKSSIQTDHRSNNYRAPEARVVDPDNHRPTQKWDVFSFGVVLLELLTGKSPEMAPAATASTSTEILDLVRWVRKGFEEEKAALWDMVDPLLLQEVHVKKEVLAAFQVAIACTETDPEIRPRMKTVSENLERIGT